jgi:hypothetical protein
LHEFFRLFGSKAEKKTRFVNQAMLRMQIPNSAVGMCRRMMKAVMWWLSDTDPEIRAKEVDREQWTIKVKGLKCISKRWKGGRVTISIDFVIENQSEMIRFVELALLWLRIDWLTNEIDWNGNKSVQQVRNWDWDRKDRLLII